MKIMVSSRTISWQIDGEIMETVTDSIFGGVPKITADGDCRHEIKRCLLFGRKVMTNLDRLLKNRLLPTKVQIIKALVFSSSHVWMWKLNYKENWAQKNWWFWTVVLEKTWDSLGRQGDHTSPRDSQGSSPTPQFKSINSSMLSLLYGSALTSIQDYWKNCSCDQTDLCRQSNASAF